MSKVITNAEFRAALARCVPPSGWKETIAVAFSGGIDSTCLLYLLHCSLSDGPSDTPNKFPKIVRSFTVNHDLQQASTTMATHCEQFAAKLGIEHSTVRIQWGQHQYPPRPPEQNYETVARDARYHALFSRMQSSSTETIAFGHHADDQVETALMRLLRGSSLLGASGMRPCRRWGMGTTSKSPLTYTGVAGMSNWIVRPFLGFSKDRLLATCEEHGLVYIKDKSNFQPDLTLRNAIRAQLTRGSDGLSPPIVSEKTQPQLNDPPLQTAPAQQLSDVHKAMQKLAPWGPADKEELRAAVAQLQERMGEVNLEVDKILASCRLPSPVGTLLLSSAELSKQLFDPMVSNAFVFRALRYVSPHPWGSLQAESFRSGDAIRRILKCIGDHRGTASFSVGSGVLWTPVLAADDNSGRIKSLPKSDPPPAGYSRAWIASRMPIYRNHPSPAIDVTEKVIQALPASSDVEILFDYRYQVRVRTGQLPDEVLQPMREGGSFKLEVNSYSKWFFPSVVWRHGHHDVRFLPSIVDGSGLDAQSLSFVQSPAVKCLQVATDSWLSASWVRPISSL
ncbi:PP-loop family-domain-containing protein [Pterulicium gracile]|uniref:tRNA(Ile)-lysidine synthetase n=1 Tax=Pterulicium gracile TaxID=1884261 RepID=A0A5C3R7J6_9AGAR|nr:PP-loop family-domain-containing protein [Pterula gracilis]